MKTITASFFTTVSFRQALQAMSFFCPWRLNQMRKGNKNKLLAEKMIEFIETKYACTFYNARGALYHGLKALEIKTGDEIIIQAFTCVSVPNAIKAVGAKPVYADIEEKNLNLDPEKIEKLITEKTKAIIIQHTFGTPAKIGKIGEINKKYGLFLIEDCAHSLGAKYQNRPVGSFGKFSVFSFGRDKVISAVNGGVLCTNDPELYQKLPQTLKLPPFWIICQNLFYNKIGYLSRLTYDFLSLGKVIIFLAKKLKLIPKITSNQENNCIDLKILNYAMPNCLAELALTELQHLNEANEHRRQLAELYNETLSDNYEIIYPAEGENDYQIFLRTALLTSNREIIHAYCKKNKIILGNWYDKVIAPKKTQLDKTDYQAGSCPIAEKVAEKIVNLPNHLNVTIKNAKRVITLLKKLHDQN